MTAGQLFAKRACKISSVGPATRRWRDGENVVKRIIQNVLDASTMPGCYSKETENELKVAFGAVYAWMDLVDGFRTITAEQHEVYSQIGPYQFAKIIGEMVDAGVSNRGEGETFFRIKRNEGLKNGC
jgi:hypothetical protein